ncbi:hypothetical protein FX988_03013 [Paraglaciecola mesophila]|uniref:Marine proteobacterial sortase target protein n=1 Tax=Paraglaciecola mesophila TaxID=197222 RepID=A0A857JL20_9ALTE|nr:marine proteobacterial sortase target protein [Paraglaciecola mesophila]QHJ12755.1 hypothetical protein FX988_03013 [Paraglaciecola mesophila]
MSLLLKFSGFLLIVSTIGVLHSAASQYLMQPDIEKNTMYNQQRLEDQTNNNASDTDTSLPAVYVDSINDVEQGSLFYLRESSEDSPPSGEHNERSNEHVRRFQLSPLLSTDVKINVTGMIARTQVTQRFHNPSQDWVNAIYAFPLPENAAVDHLNMIIGERKMTGEIMPKKQAKAHFETAKKQGRKASLIEQQRPNLFTNAIANIGPNETISVTIEYQQVIRFDQQTFSLRFPMTITPRYSPSASQKVLMNQTSVAKVNPNGWGKNVSVLSQQIKTPDEPANPIRISVELDSGFSMSPVDIVSEHHPIDITSNDQQAGHYHIELTKEHIANQDFSLRWKPTAGDIPSAAHFSETIGNYRYGMVMLTPPTQDDADDKNTMTPVSTREIVFLLDTSGSMAGESIVQAKRAVDFALAQLHPEDSVNVIEFNDAPQALWKMAMPATANNIQRARNWVASLSANGGTEMAPALSLALHKTNLGQPNTDRVSPVQLRQVVFITDGSVSNEDALMSLIENQLADSRLFTIGIGSAPNSYFMTQAAQAGRGTFTYIGDINQAQQKMTELFSKLTRPVMQDIHIEFARDTEFYPSVIPDLYQDQPVVIHYRAPVAHLENGMQLQQPDNAVKVTGWQATNASPSKPWSIRMPLSPTAKSAGMGVAWAREKIEQLSHTLRRERDSTMRQTWRQSITEIALEHHMVSQFTSLIAVDEQEANSKDTKPDHENSKNKPINHNAPAGLAMAGVQMHGKLPQTATNIQLSITLGLLLFGAALAARRRFLI